MDKKKLAVIHIVKKELSLSDGEYRNILERITGVRSAKDLTDNRFHKLMRYFVRTRHYRVTNKGITLRQKYYLRQLKESLQWDDACPSQKFIIVIEINSYEFLRGTRDNTLCYIFFRNTGFNPLENEVFELVLSINWSSTC